eukprot:TRINITY_DN801_c0_g1_i5.p4 TRINITY_DN801_c0_g1~~TRINITY_DN801_c0_g1_i5.p4  ORF type:complete len:201 (-),score=28.82 TRINITY_DN801_c0_g1_i5:267-869(-)
MMLMALLLLSFQVTARELQGKEVVVATKSRQSTRYYKPTYSSKTHYTTPIINVVPSNQKKVIPSYSKKLASPVKTNIVIVEQEEEHKSPILVVSPKLSPTPVPEASNKTSPSQSPSPLPTPEIEPSPSPVPSPITPDEKTPSDSSPIVIPSPSPSPSPVPSPACFDNPPDAEYTCSEQASFGRCNATFLQGFCDKACGRC